MIGSGLSPLPCKPFQLPCVGLCMPCVAACCLQGHRDACSSVVTVGCTVDGEKLRSLVLENNPRRDAPPFSIPLPGSSRCAIDLESDPLESAFSPPQIQPSGSSGALLVEAIPQMTAFRAHARLRPRFLLLSWRSGLLRSSTASLFAQRRKCCEPSSPVVRVHHVRPEAAVSLLGCHAWLGL